jgi:hypothetical protein
VARVSLAEKSGPEETGNRKPDDQHYRCNLPRPHTSTFPGGTRQILLSRFRLR